MKKTISLILKAIVVIFATSGTLINLGIGTKTFMGGINSLKYFTIQSNIAIALVCLTGAIILIRKQDIPEAWQSIKFVSTVAITLTGAVFCFMLAPTMGTAAWNKVNIFTHVIVPIASIADFFVIGKRLDISKWKVVYCILPPLAYLVFAAIGYVCGWEFSQGKNYPYFFLNWGSPVGAFGLSSTFPFLGCVWWIAILFILITVIGLIYISVLDLINKKHK